MICWIPRIFMINEFHEIRSLEFLAILGKTLGIQPKQWFTFESKMTVLQTTQWYFPGMYSFMYRPLFRSSHWTSWVTSNSVFESLSRNSDSLNMNFRSILALLLIDGTAPSCISRFSISIVSTPLIALKAEL